MTLCELAYVDNVILLAKEEEDMRLMMGKLKENLKRKGVRSELRKIHNDEIWAESRKKKKIEMEKR